MNPEAVVVRIGQLGMVVVVVVVVGSTSCLSVFLIKFPSLQHRGRLLEIPL